MGCCPSRGAEVSGREQRQEASAAAGPGPAHAVLTQQERLEAVGSRTSQQEPRAPIYAAEATPSRPMRPQVHHRGRRRGAADRTRGEGEKGTSVLELAWPPACSDASRCCSSAEVTPPLGAGHSPHPFLCLFLPPPLSPQFSPFPSGPPWCLPGGGAKASCWEESWARAASVHCPRGRLGRGGHSQA